MKTCEKSNFQSYLNFRLPHYFLAIGLGLGILAMISILIVGSLENEYTTEKELLKTVIVAAGFLAVLARDKEEDERTLHIRGQAFTLAFLGAAFQGIIMPVAMMVGLWIKGKPVVYEDADSFIVLFTLCYCYLAFYYVLKKRV